MDSSVDPNCMLNNGLLMPKVGLAISQNQSDDLIYTVVVDYGYRHLYTVSFYKNEEVVGEAIQKVLTETDIRQEDLFVVTKVWQNQKEDIRGAFDKSLKKLKLDYDDLTKFPSEETLKSKLTEFKLSRFQFKIPFYFSTHQPAFVKVEEGGKIVPGKIANHVAWAELEKLVNEGLIKSIGVPNFNVQSLLDMLAYCETKPVCNQIELHPYLVQDELVKFMKDNEIIRVVYYPLVGGGDLKRNSPKDILKLELFQEHAEKYDRTAGQIILNWGLHRGHCIIPKIFNKERLIENKKSQEFITGGEDYQKISDLDCGRRCFPGINFEFLCYTPVFA
ncbi:unnamed protein product [Moneuplotes crassus]|uniref:NADP-dependent oxidoreductase domain-containing protein n=1 Tax=Euplotes crassus TaxID=5936 RepID=A0AAD1UA49_EUPCR|nr:unnamed protein product [Moneuplotes crassus]